MLYNIYFLKRYQSKYNIRVFLLLTQSLILVKCCVAIVKIPPALSVVIFFSSPSWSMIPIHLVLSTAQAGAKGRERCCTCERCCTFHYLSRIDSIKPDLHFSFFIFGMVAFEESTFHQNFYIYWRIRAKVPMYSKTNC